MVIKLAHVQQPLHSGIPAGEQEPQSPYLYQQYAEVLPMPLQRPLRILLMVGGGGDA